MLKKIFILSCFIGTVLANGQIMLPAYQAIQYVDEIPQVTICNQTWSAVNLDTSTYNDGTPIPQVTDTNVFAGLTTGAWCYYNNDPLLGNIYGKIYNWYAIAGIYDAASLSNPTLRKNIAPVGWHIPTKDEWKTLFINCLNNNLSFISSQLYESYSGPASCALRETGTNHWTSPNNNANNSTGFTALPGGLFYSGTAFTGMGDELVLWSSTQYFTNTAWWCYIYRQYATGTICDNNSIAFQIEQKVQGAYARCIKD